MNYEAHLRLQSALNEHTGLRWFYERNDTICTAGRTHELSRLHTSEMILRVGENTMRLGQYSGKAWWTRCAVEVARVLSETTGATP